MLSLETARAWYPHDPDHGFDHILRVYHLAEQIARAEGADLELVLTAVLLHDAHGGLPSAAGGRATHHHDSAAFARQVLEAEGWPEGRITAVQHAIRSHRFRDNSEPPGTLEAKILFDADKLDAIGAIGAARAITYAAKHGQPAYAEPSERFCATGELEPGEPYSAYHEYIFKLRHLRDRLHTPTAQVLAEDRHTFMAGFFERLRLEVAPP
jgi:uncharacterized protein